MTAATKLFDVVVLGGGPAGASAAMHCAKAGLETLFVVKEPVGVVVAIAPFNYPLTLLTFKLGAALVTGCTVVAKPATATPLTTLRLAELFRQVGYPPGAFNAITGSGAELGNA